MSNPPIPPALTEEEWKDGYLTVPGFIRETHAGLFDGYVRITAQTDDSTDVVGPDRHALAALCLYDQPFGFTREDVVVLGKDIAGEHIDDIDLDRLAHIRDRIAALLPPETPVLPDPQKNVDSESL